MYKNNFIFFFGELWETLILRLYLEHCSTRWLSSYTLNLYITCFDRMDCLHAECVKIKILSHHKFYKYGNHYSEQSIFLNLKTFRCVIYYNEWYFLPPKNFIINIHRNVFIILCFHTLIGLGMTVFCRSMSP